MQDHKPMMILILALGVIWLLCKMDRKEGFSVIPSFPYLPPKNWRPRAVTNWSPWWYHQNEYHPAVPEVSQYDPMKNNVTDRYDAMMEELGNVEIIPEEESIGNRKMKINKKQLIMVIGGIVLLYILFAR